MSSRARVSSKSRARFEKQRLLDLLQSLTPHQRLAFGLSCGERLYPNYVTFFVQYEWGDPDAIRSALDSAWDALLGTSPSRETLLQCKKDVEAAEPDTADFESILVSSALDAAVATGLVLQLMEANNLALALEIATLARDSVDLTRHPRRPVQAAAEKAMAKIQKDPRRFAKVNALKKEIPDIASAEFSFNWEAYDLADFLQRLIDAGCLAIDHDTAQALGLFAGLMELEQVESFEVDPNPEAPVYILLRCCDVGALDVDFWSTPEKIAELTKIIEPILADIEGEIAQ
jgi:uncharacterized protein YjaG (DUF416 family)